MKSANKKKTPEHVLFSSERVESILDGLTIRKLQYWAQNRYILPSHYKVNGEFIKAEDYDSSNEKPDSRRRKDYARYYSFEKLVEIQVFLRLRKRGISCRNLKKAWDNFLKIFPERRITEAKIFAYEGRIYLRIDRERVLELLNGQVGSLEILFDEADRDVLLEHVQGKIEDLPPSTPFEYLPNLESL